MMRKRKQLETEHGGLRSGCRRCCASPGVLRAAFTLVELLVAVLIMVLMMLAFGMILSESQKTVSIAQNQSRGNQIADAIARTLRNDLARLSKNGFLCITRYQAGVASRPYLLFTTSGNQQSRVGAYRTLDGISIYGWATPTPGGGAVLAQYTHILFREGFLTWDSGGGNESDLLAADVLNTSLARIQTKSRVDIDTYLNQLYEAGRIPRDDDYFVYPPQQLSDVAKCWQILSAEINSLGIQWTDGSIHSTNETLNWFGIDSDSDAQYRDPATGNPAESGWKSYDIGDNVPEYQSTYGYRALWTHHNQNNWPKAIRVKFTIYDEEFQKASGQSATEYEVIVPIE